MTPTLPRIIQNRLGALVIRPRTKSVREETANSDSNILLVWTLRDSMERREGGLRGAEGKGSGGRSLMTPFFDPFPPWRFFRVFSET